MALTSYDLSGGTTQSSAITASNGYLNMKLASTAELSKYVTVSIECSLDGGTTWKKLKDSGDKAIKKVIGGTVAENWLVTDIPTGVTSLRQKLDVPQPTTGVLTITDYVGS